MRRKVLLGAGLLAVILVSTAGPAWAHGIGGRTDLPLPVWQLAWAAGFAVAVSFVALGAFWKTPILAAAGTGWPLPATSRLISRAVDPVLKIVGVASLGLVIVAAWWGNTNPRLNIAPQLTYIWFWVGIQFASMLLGDFWRTLNPFYTLADLAAAARARFTGTAMSECAATPRSEWPAVVAISSFLWMELGFHDSSSPRALGVWLTLYTAAILAGASIWGREWVRGAEGFGVLFAKLGAISPFHRTPNGEFRIRTPLSGLATMVMAPGAVTFLLVVLGSTSFDGFTRSSTWRSLIANRSGWDLTFTRTWGVVTAILVVSLAFRVAAQSISRVTSTPTLEVLRRFGPSLVPIVGAYSVAHYFSFLVLDGQILLIRISDPFGRGWDLFGTVGYHVKYTLISVRQIAWVQTLAIAVGHVLGIATAHDKSVEVYPRDVAAVSQLPMLGVMISYTVLGLVILLGH